ncbi:MAG TPA: hypothetical protein VN369_08205 [Terriglobales bacterium]|nr:hypothetical protein [Terriglobales bacterium]
MSACSYGAEPAEDLAANPPPTPPETAEPAGDPPAEKVTAGPQPAADPVSEQDITVEATPVTLTERPEFRPEDRVREEELVSLQGYSIGMTFAEAQQVWEIPKNVVDYGMNRWTPEMPNLCIYVGNMYYDFRPRPDADASDFDNYVLSQFYYGESIFCTNREPLSVLRDIELGDMIGDVLKSLPGNRTPRKWALDQLYGEYRQPDSASLEYTTNLGFYDLRIYCDSCWLQLMFGSSGKLWIAEVYAY